ncbi:hypothetical protein ACFWBG_01305 [Nocardia salmonicida]|uniref:hypothetical protein n=1 Tax=Nocardia salmonicida TaxID=53431 RepID=UPI00366BC907
MRRNAPVAEFRGPRSLAPGVALHVVDVRGQYCPSHFRGNLAADDVQGEEGVAFWAHDPRAAVAQIRAAMVDRV